MSRITKYAVPAFAARWALFLDVDGTLVDFVDDPEASKADRRLIDTMRRLCELLGGAVALVSGRTIDSVDAVVDPLRLPTAGLHGHERRDGTGRIHRAGVDEKALGAVTERFESIVAQFPGTFIEEKGSALALHFRKAPAAAAHVDALALELDDQLPEPYCVQRGKMVVEVRSCETSKASAIEAFMAEPPFTKRAPVFVGDDATDEHGFRWVNEHDGLSIKVGSGDTSARFRIASVSDVVRWLGDYVAFLEQRRGDVDRVS